jgi:hypothetical protein
MSKWRIGKIDIQGTGVVGDGNTLYVSGSTAKPGSAQPLGASAPQASPRSGNPKVFLSYSHKDREIVDALRFRLEGKGIAVWMDNEQLLPGEVILDKLWGAIQECEWVLLCCSRNSLNSTWVEDEIAMVIEKERLTQKTCLVPIDLDGYLRQWSSGTAPRVRARVTAVLDSSEGNPLHLEYEVDRLTKVLSSKRLG